MLTDGMLYYFSVNIILLNSVYIFFCILIFFFTSFRYTKAITSNRALINVVLQIYD